MDVKVILGIFIIMNITWISPVFSQWQLFGNINDEYFYRIKIKRFKFMFKAIAYQSVSEHGIILTMLLQQISGYILALVSCIFTIIYLSISKNLLVCFIVVFTLCMVENLSFVVNIFITSAISRKREESSCS